MFSGKATSAQVHVGKNRISLKMNSLNTISDNATFLFHSISPIIYLSDPVNHLKVLQQKEIWKSLYIALRHRGKNFLGYVVSGEAYIQQNTTKLL